MHEPATQVESLYSLASWTHDGIAIKSELEDFPLESRLDLGVGVGQNAAFVKNENEIDSEEVTLNFKSKGPFIYFQRDSIILNNL